MFEESDGAIANAPSTQHAGNGAVVKKAGCSEHSSSLVRDSVQEIRHSRSLGTAVNDEIEELRSQNQQ